MSKKESDLTKLFTQVIDKQLESVELKLLEEIYSYIRFQLAQVKTSMHVYEIPGLVSDSCLKTAKQYNILQGQKLSLETILCHMKLKYGGRLEEIDRKRSIASSETFPGRFEKQT